MGGFPKPGTPPDMRLKRNQAAAAKGKINRGKMKIRKSDEGVTRRRIRIRKRAAC